MRSSALVACCRLGVVLWFLAPSVAGAQSRIDQGREVLKGVRAMHLMIDFGIEAVERDQIDSLELAFKLTPRKDGTELGDDEWTLRLGMLKVEQLGRDLIAGRPIPGDRATILEQHFQMPRDPVWRWRVTEEDLHSAEESHRQYSRILEESAEKLAGGRQLDETQFAVVRGRQYAFRSGAQLDWNPIDLALDIPALRRAYASAQPRSRHAIRVLIGRQAKADEQTEAFLLDALRGETPIERCDAAFAAAAVHSPTDKLISALIACLDDPDPRVARASVRVLLALDADRSAPAMLQRLQETTSDEARAQVDEKLGFVFEEYDISDSHIGFRYDLPTELMFALGRFRYRAAIPLLWEIVQGKGREVWRHTGIYELDHGGVALEAIAAIDPDDGVATACRALGMKSATVDALGAAANVLGEWGRPDDIRELIDLMSRLDGEARAERELHYDTSRSMLRTTFACERLLFFADASERDAPQIRQAFVNELRRCSSGPFAEPMIAALEYFDPHQVAMTALGLVVDTRAEADARRIAAEILGRTGNLQHVEPLIALIEDNGNATNGPVGFHAVLAATKILDVADAEDPQVASLRQTAIARIEQAILAGRWSYGSLGVLIRLDSDRAVKFGSARALDATLEYFSRSAALQCIASEAKPNRALAMPLRPLLDVSLPETHATESLRAAALAAIARLLGMASVDDGTLEARVRRELEKSAIPESR